MNVFERAAKDPSESDEDFLAREQAHIAQLAEQRGRVLRTRANVERLMKGARDLNEPQSHRGTS